MILVRIGTAIGLLVRPKCATAHLNPNQQWMLYGAMCYNGSPQEVSLDEVEFAICMYTLLLHEPLNKQVDIFIRIDNMHNKTFFTDGRRLYKSAVRSLSPNYHLHNLRHQFPTNNNSP